MDYSQFRWLEQAVIREAREMGFDGQPFSIAPIPLGTEEQEWAAVNLSLSIRPLLRSATARRLVRVWTRNILLTSSSLGGHKKARGTQTRSAEKRIALERRRLRA